MMEDEDRCEPWYYPPLDPSVRLCSPFEAMAFQKVIDKMPTDVCQVGEFGDMVTSLGPLVLLAIIDTRIKWYTYHGIFKATKRHQDW